MLQLIDIECQFTVIDMVSCDFESHCDYQPVNVTQNCRLSTLQWRNLQPLPGSYRQQFPYYDHTLKSSYGNKKLVLKKSPRKNNEREKLLQIVIVSLNAFKSPYVKCQIALQYFSRVDYVNCLCHRLKLFFEIPLA
jgi:hypothetical protein